MARGDLDRGGATTASGILGHLGATTNGAKHIRKVILFCFSRSRHRPPQMAIFNRPTECVNNTPSTTAHFQRLRTPAHACTHLNNFFAWLTSDITNKRITKLFISSEAFPKNSCSSNKEMIKEISVLKHQYLHLSPLRS